MDDNFLKEVLFPYLNVRDSQDLMIRDVHNALKNRLNMIVHAPTGIGKTIAALAPSLSISIKNNLNVFFLTSRHTQHNIAVNTLRQIKKKYNIDFNIVDIIGKKWMCLQPGVEILHSNDFVDYCKKLREHNKCEFFSNSVKKSHSSTIKAKKICEELKILGPMNVNEIIHTCKKEMLCPYEISSLLGKEANVLIADYYYIFNQNIRESLFSRINKKLENSIIIVDEAHNLPTRLRELLTSKLTTFMIKNSIKEANAFKFFETADNLRSLKEHLNLIGGNLDNVTYEKIISKADFMDLISKNFGYDDLISDLTFIGEEIKSLQKISYISSIARFLKIWLGPDKGFARILSKNSEKENISLNYRCLDPSLISAEIISKSYSTIIMSGTLNPTFMYKEILSFPDQSIEKVYKNPFPKKNRLSLIIPLTSTKFSRRSKEEFVKISDICSEIVSLIPGNIALFYPSYELMLNVYNFFREKCQKKIFVEKPRLNKTEKETLLERFKSEKKNGAVLLGVSSGSFGEGIDMPGILSGVIVVGLPLNKPDLETKELIEYYEDKFGKGFDYGYIYPAITKCLQNAGRCIRSEKDKGIIIFLDERFAWNNYYKCFPVDMEIRISTLYKQKIKDFFNI